jgi:hypothetical protein
MDVNRDEYVDTGGLFWGPTLRGRFYSNRRVSRPFAEIAVSSNYIRIVIRNWNLQKINETIELEKPEVTAVRRKGLLWAYGVKIEHQKPETPSTILFWPANPKRLFEELRRFGYNVLDSRK